jgi:hypothetical protein
MLPFNLFASSSFPGVAKINHECRMIYRWVSIDSKTFWPSSSNPSRLHAFNTLFFHGWQ